MRGSPKSYSLYLLQEYGDINFDFKHYASKNAGTINTLRSNGYDFYIENGNLTQVVTYSMKDDFAQTVTQRVYRNSYYMVRDPDTRLFLCEGLAYRCDLTMEQLQKQCVVKSIVDLSLKGNPKQSKGDNPLDYLVHRYGPTEQQFVEFLCKYRERFEEYLTQMYADGYRLKVSLEKTQKMQMFRLKEQYQMFAQHKKRFTVVLNDKLVSLPLQLIATRCNKAYELIKADGSAEPVVIFSAEGFASVYDLYLRDYYRLVV